MVIKISAKCSDMFYMSAGGEEYTGYVPDFFPGEHYGDYVELEIDTKTGKILNWPEVKDIQVREYLTNEA